MRTLDDFKLIIKDFAETLNGMHEKELIEKVYGFMEKHNFQEHVIVVICDSPNLRIVFLTDNENNDNGIVYIQDDTAYSFVASLNDFLEKLPGYIVTDDNS